MPPFSRAVLKQDLRKRSLFCSLRSPDLKQVKIGRSWLTENGLYRSAGPVLRNLSFVWSRICENVPSSVVWDRLISNRSKSGDFDLQTLNQNVRDWQDFQDEGRLSRQGIPWNPGDFFRSVRTCMSIEKQTPILKILWILWILLLILLIPKILLQTTGTARDRFPHISAKKIFFKVFTIKNLQFA